MRIERVLATSDHLNVMQVRPGWEPGAIASGAERQQLAVIVQHPAPSGAFWLERLPGGRSGPQAAALRQACAVAPITTLRRSVAVAATLLADRPPDYSQELRLLQFRFGQLLRYQVLEEAWAELMAARVDLRDGTGEGAGGQGGGLRRRRLGLARDRALALCWRADRHLRELIEEHRRSADWVQECSRDVQQRMAELRELQRERTAWDERHVGILARGEEFAHELLDREDAALLALGEDPPGYLLTELGRLPAGGDLRALELRRNWLYGALIIERYRVDAQISDPIHALGTQSDIPELRDRFIWARSGVDLARTELGRVDLQPGHERGLPGVGEDGLGLGGF